MDTDGPLPEPDSAEAAAGAPTAGSVSIVIPTFREVENLPLLIPRIDEACTDAGLTYEVIVVDDDSRDGTEEACLALAEALPVRIIVRRNERGLSSAVLRGLEAASGDVLLVMDGDLSHPPTAIPELLRALENGKDFVIGSRYVEGGSTDADWGLFRWLNSKFATLLARPLTSARDPMAGFFALRRDTFERAQELNPIGYKIGLELIVKCGCKAIGEVPIHFTDRQHGTSKLNLKEQWKYLLHLARLYAFRARKLPRLLRFLGVGATGMVVDLLLFGVLLQLLPVRVSRALAIWGAMSWNFAWNRRVTFPRARRDSRRRQYVLFCCSCLLGALVNWGVSVWLVLHVALFAEWKLLAAIVGIVCGTAFNYVLSAKVAFRRAA